jgi:hypothetical protein
LTIRMETLPPILLATILTFSAAAIADPHPTPAKIVVRGEEVKDNDLPAAAIQKTTQCLSSFKFNVERQASDNAIVITFKIPGDISTAWQQVVQSCHDSAAYLGKNATACGKWLDRGGRNPSEIPSAYMNPVITSATKYCAKFHTVSAGDGRAKTIAER